MIKDEDIIKLGYKKSTLKSYIYRAINELKESGRIILINKEWLGIDNDKNYIKINEVQYNYLMDLYKKYYDKCDNSINSYSDVSNSFILFTGLYPIKVPVYDVGAF